MATAQQVTANRANALYSTGPKTEEGKSASSLNGVKHNLTSQYLIILPNQQDAFAELESGLRAKLTPNGTLEEVLYKRIVECAWNLERCRMAEFELHSGGYQDPLLSDHTAASCDRIHRYARESENAMHKSLRELSKLQTEGQFRQELCPLSKEQLADPVEVAGTIHSLSQGCFLSRIMKLAIACHKTESEARSAAQYFQALGMPHPLEYANPSEANTATAQPSLPQELAFAVAA